MTLLYLLGALLWLVSIVVALALCKAASRGDRQLGYDTDPYLFHERQLKRRRACKREAIFTTDHEGRERLGL